MATIGLLKQTPDPSEQDIARLMDRNVCRCGAYARIVRAVRIAADRMKSTPAGARR
jgi:aerobic-type carbon monoxide dehydrogenase small subunit (CoxS/CutS family)